MRTLKGYLLQMKLGQTPDERILAEEMVENMFRDLTEDMQKAVTYLREGKLKIAPNTTNSLVDSLIEKYSTPEGNLK